MANNADQNLPTMAVRVGDAYVVFLFSVKSLTENRLLDSLINTGIPSTIGSTEPQVGRSQTYDPSSSVRADLQIGQRSNRQACSERLTPDDIRPPVYDR